MSNEALSMAKLLVSAVTRGDVNGQYHWAELLKLDAISRGAKGPKADQHDALDAALIDPGRSMAEDDMERARR